MFNSGPAERCKMGDTAAMMEMYRLFRSRLSAGYLKIEREFEENHDIKAFVQYVNSHSDDSSNIIAAIFWVQRAQLYGNREANDMIKNHNVYSVNTYLPRSMFIPGRGPGSGVSPETLRAIGLTDFKGTGSCYLRAINEDGIYIAEKYMGYDGPDDDGYGMEDYSDYDYYDEFFNYLYTAKHMSNIDLRLMEKEIESKCAAGLERARLKRASYWSRRGDSGKYSTEITSFAELHTENGVLTECIDFVSDEIVIPEGVAKIAERAFYNCRRVQRIKVPEGVTEIGTKAFSDCRGLKSIELPKSLRVIGEGAFYWCNNLESVIIPEGVTRIENETFLSCHALTNVVFPSGLKFIGDGAFKHCDALKDVNVPSGVEIGEDAFYKANK